MAPKSPGLLQLLPAMARIGLGDALGGLRQLYLRSAWRRRGVRIEATTRLLCASPESMDLGYGTEIGHFSIVAALATPDCPEIPTLRIGERTWIGDHVNIRAVGGLIAIGNACLIANAVTIISCTHGIKPDANVRDQPLVRADVQIGDDVWIGAGVTVLPGSIIGQGAVVGAGAVVRGRIEPYDIVVGVPARTIGSRKNRL